MQIIVVVVVVVAGSIRAATTAAADTAFNQIQIAQIRLPFEILIFQIAVESTRIARRRIPASFVCGRQCRRYGQIVVEHKQIAALGILARMFFAIDYHRLFVHSICASFLSALSHFRPIVVRLVQNIEEEAHSNG